MPAEGMGGEKEGAKKEMVKAKPKSSAQPSKMTQSRGLPGPDLWPGPKGPCSTYALSPRALKMTRPTPWF